MQASVAIGRRAQYQPAGMQDLTFRLFISSTFADFRHEREALHTRVFPALEAHCRSLGARFDVVDLRWGISPDAQNDLQTLRICLDEVERCRRIGLLPHFVALVGDRYGWQPAPVEIDAASWRRITRTKGADRAQLEEFYRFDHNATPPIWALRREAYARADEPQRVALLRALRRLARENGLAEEDHPTIFAAATHQEILQGLLRRDGQDGGIAYLRQIEGLPLSAEGAPYIDTGPNGFDAEAHARVIALKTKLRAHLPVDHVREVQAAWTGKDVSTDHVEDFCAQFFADHKALIEKSIASARARDAGDDAHAAFAQERARLFVGQRAPLAKVLRYAREGLANRARTVGPLVVEGDGGTGKSSLLAKAAMMMRRDRPNACILTRFVGAAPGSESLAPLLSDLAVATCRGLGRALPALATTYPEASAGFGAALAAATPDQPLVLFIDALDQFSRSDQLALLDWLPDTLPAHVRVIVSVRPGPLAQEARRRFARTLMRLKPMASGDSRAMLDRMLADAGRTLTFGQRAMVQRASPGLPLWTRLAFEEARTWRSDEPGRRLEKTVEGLIRARIAALSTPANHGAALVSEALGAIAASRFGLSDGELAQALARERAPAVWAEFRARSFHAWDHPHLPAIVWLRLRADLSAYLVEQRVDGALTYRFFHREFTEVVTAMTLAGSAKAVMHARLADVFSIPPDTGLYRLCDTARVQDSAALRRIMEQPWQLSAAGNVEGLTALIDSVDFVAAKCAANRVADLMQDIARLESARRDDAGAASASWPALLRGWRAMLEQADQRWPAHRVLIQLLLEADPHSVPQHAQARSILSRTPPDWSVLISATPQPYVPALADALETMRKMAGAAPLAKGFLAIWDETGGLRILDRRSGALVARHELGSVKAARAELDRLRGLYGTVEAAFDRPSANNAAPSSLSVASHGLTLTWPWDGCLTVAHSARRSEIILGKGEIDFLGETDQDLYFLCDERIVIAQKARLAALSAGIFSFGGLQIQGLAIKDDDGGWTHQRFNSVVFVDPDSCLTLGFSGRGGQRDDVILEMYKATENGVRRVGYGLTDHDLDLPIWHICGLNDGSVILASERYWHTFIWSPPFEGDSVVEMLAGAAVGNNDIGNWVNHGDKDGNLTFQPTSPSTVVAFDAPGVFGSFGGDYHVCGGVTHIETDDHSAAPAFTGFESVGADGVLARWHCDVRPHWIFARDSGDFIVFKNSGPVRVVRWLA